MEWTALYLTASVLLYWAMYSNAVDFNFRIDHSQIDSSTIWRFLITSNRETWKLWSLDFLKIHCPWSKETSVKYRVQEVNRLLTDCSMKHEKGWTAEDCHNPEKHRQIAHDCFCYRTTFWIKGLLDIFIISPIRMALLVIVVLVAEVALPLIELYRFVFSR